LEPAGLIDGEQSFDRAFAALGAAAEGKLAPDNGCAEAALGGVLVGSTADTSANVQSAGQSFKRLFASARTCRCRFRVEPGA